MESDAFKIPLRPNPSTLPNVFPTILHARSQAFKTNRKGFSFYPFSRKHVLSDQYTSCPKRRTRTTGSVDVDRPSDSPLLLTRLSREWIKGLAWAWTHVLLLSPCLTKAITLTLYWISSSGILHQCGALTQVCVVWSFINGVGAAGVCGGLWPLDPSREMTTFSICLTPPASKTVM